MNSAHQPSNPSRKSVAGPASSLVTAALIGLLIGATPGVILVLLAQFVIEGEMQLSVGAPGILLAVAGGVIGSVIAGFRHTRERSV